MVLIGLIMVGMVCDGCACAEDGWEWVGMGLDMGRMDAYCLEKYVGEGVDGVFFRYVQ